MERIRMCLPCIQVLTTGMFIMKADELILHCLIVSDDVLLAMGGLFDVPVLDINDARWVLATQHLPHGQIEWSICRLQHKPITIVKPQSIFLGFHGQPFKNWTSNNNKMCCWNNIRYEKRTKGDNSLIYLETTLQCQVLVVRPAKWVDDPPWHSSLTLTVKHRQGVDHLKHKSLVDSKRAVWNGYPFVCLLLYDSQQYSS